MQRTHDNRRIVIGAERQCVGRSNGTAALIVEERSQ
jgi:hypothetical protein